MLTKKQKIIDENRSFNEQLQLNYFIYAPTKIKFNILFVLLCYLSSKHIMLNGITLLYMKKILRNIPMKLEKILSRSIRKNWCRKSFFFKVSTNNELCLAASYKVCLQIAKFKQPFRDGVLIKKMRGYDG